MTKKTKTFFEIFLQGIGLYFSNAISFLKYMLFPVFGQLFGGIVIFYSVILYNSYLTDLITTHPLLNTPLYKNLIYCVVLIPGIIIYLSALWKYLISYSAVSSMAENLIKSDKLYDLPAHNMLVTQRWFQYLCLCIMYLIVILLTFLPVFWVIGGILLIYFTFIFQIFIFENNLSAFDCFKKSSIYVQGSFFKILALILLLFGLTYCAIPHIIYTLLNITKTNNILVSFISEGIQTSALYNINLMLSAFNYPPVAPIDIAKLFVFFIIYIIIIQLLLPLRIICMFLWYKYHCNDNDIVKKFDEKFLKKAKAKYKKYEKN